MVGEKVARGRVTFFLIPETRWQCGLLGGGLDVISAFTGLNKGGITNGIVND